MNDECFLAAIIADPDADLPRLAYADWLEEDGQQDRAEFIRDGIAVCYPERLNPHHDMGAGWDGVVDIMTQYPPDPSHCALCAAISRQRNSRVPQRLALEIGGLTGMPADWSGRKDSGANYVGVRCRRGFVAGVRCPLAAWSAAGPAIVRVHPVKELTITDRLAERRHRDSPQYGWFCYTRDGLPTAPELDAVPYPVWRLLPPEDQGRGTSKYFEGLEAAAVALRAAALCWAREHRGARSRA